MHKRPVAAAFSLALFAVLTAPAAGFAAGADTSAGSGTPASPAPSASPSVQPAPSVAASPSVSPTAQPQPSAAPSSAVRPKAVPSGPDLSLLRNRDAQAELIADLASAEAHALILQKGIDQAQQQLVAIGPQLFDNQRKLEAIDGQLNIVRAQHMQASQALQEDRIQLAQIVRRVYKAQNNFFLDIVDAGGFAGLLRAMGYDDAVVEREQNLVNAVQADEDALQRSETELERSRSNRKDVVDQLERASNAVQVQLQLEQNLQGQLQATIDLALQALDAMQTDTPQVAAERAKLVKMKTDDLVRQIENTVWTQDVVTSAIQLPPFDPQLASTGKFLWPIPHAVVTQPFGPTNFTFEAAYAGFPHFHTGLDLAVPLGTPVFAAADGVVLQAQAMTDGSGNLIGYGNFILIQHDAGLKTLYGHLLAYMVKPGDLIKRGQLIGLVGSTGNSTGPHTHFEVRVDNTPIDPVQVLPAQSS